MGENAKEWCSFGRIACYKGNGNQQMKNSENIYKILVEKLGTPRLTRTYNIKMELETKGMGTWTAFI
jgi:hypothetical protein